MALFNYKPRLAALLSAFVLCCAAAAADEDTPANALLLIPSSQTAFDAKFQDFLNKSGARLIDSYPPSVFIGYIPQTLDKKLKDTYGAVVYREKVDDWSSFARYGEKAVLAVNLWNKRFLEDPPAAPLIVSSKVQRAGKKGEGINLSWNEMMKAVSYRLQISQDEQFSSVVLDTMLKHNSYKLFPAFWSDGVYYWRVAGVLTLNTGVVKESDFSKPDSFAVSKPPRTASAAKPAAPALPAEARFTGAYLRWDPSTGKYYRLQFSETDDFSSPEMDVFADTCSYRTAGLDLKRGAPYYMRVMASDGWLSSAWSAVCRIVVDPEDRAAANARRKAQR